jgi:hypothetical protein
MDIKTHILRWEREIQENPAVLALGIIILLAVVFIAAMLIDGFIKNRQKKKRKRG